MPSGGLNKIDLKGVRFGKLVVKRLAGSSARGLALWECVCDCKNVVVISGYYLRQGRRKSCGCENYRLKGVRNPNWTGYKEISGTYWNRLIQNAKVRGLIFQISMEDVWKQYIKQNRLCALTGRVVSFANNTASVDRVDSKVGYFNNNIQIVHKLLNKIKWELNNEDFRSVCKEVVTYESTKSFNG